MLNKEGGMIGLSNVTIGLPWNFSFQAVIFCHTKASAKWLANKMHQEGYVVALLSGELDVTQRATILKRFRDGKERVLVTTNVCARGIDVEQVTLVVNFDLPMTKVSSKIRNYSL